MIGKRGTTLSEVMALIDTGYLPFLPCDRCHDLMPASLEHGLGGSVVTKCGKCRTFGKPNRLQFFTVDEAHAMGWKMEELSSAPAH